MFESAELGHVIDKATYDAEVPGLRADLLDAQLEVALAKKFPVIVLVGGVDGSGKGDTVNLLSEWMDPRHIRTNGMGEPTDEERERPPMWRVWRRLPPKGTVGIFFGSWYTQPIADRAYGRSRAVDLDSATNEILRFERMLTDEGALVLKFWFHLSKRLQKKQLKHFEKDASTRFRVTESDWKNHRHYDQLRKVTERTLRLTSTTQAPWIVVEAYDARYRHLTVAKTLRDAFRKRLSDGDVHARPHAPPPVRPLDGRDVLDSLDLGQTVTKDEYDEKLPKLQARLNELSRDPKFAKRSLVVVFEGNDAAGKGGAIRRITSALDARRYEVVPVAAPTDEERAQPYLWRFWRHVPRTGHIALFDRSWYGRVLVERVEELCATADWMRAYGEINDFEESLAASGAIVVKFWMAVSKHEQLVRFKAREKTSFKQFKITDEDWRNRKKWGAYAHAVCDMIDRTSTNLAPWTLIEANDKNFARLKILKTVCDRMKRGV